MPFLAPAPRKSRPPRTLLGQRITPGNGYPTSPVDRLAEAVDLVPAGGPQAFRSGSLPVCGIDAVFFIGVTHGSRVATLGRDCGRPGRPGLAPSRSGRGAHTQGRADLTKADRGLVEPPTPASGLCPAKVKPMPGAAGENRILPQSKQGPAPSSAAVAGKSRFIAAGTGHNSGKSEAGAQL